MQDSLRFWIPRREFRNILCQWKLDSRFQSLVGFRIPYAVFQIPKPRIQDSGFRTPQANSGILEIEFAGFRNRYSLARGRQDDWDI